MKTIFLRSIGFKILFFYILLALINISFIISIIFENQVELLSKNAKLETEQQISNLIGSLKKFSAEMKKGTLFIHGEDRKSLDRFIDVIRPYASSFIIITDDKKVLHKSAKTLELPQTIDEDVLRSVTVENFSGKEYYIRIDDSKNIIYCYIPLGNFQLANTILLVRKDISSLNKSLKGLYSQAVYVVLVALFFHAIFALILFRYIITPVKLLREGAQKLSEGDFSARIFMTERVDEFGSLAESFNKMADAISENVATLSGKAKQAIEAINRSDLQTVKDDLTGLFSRIYMIERIKEETTKARITRGSLALMIVDIDDFEKIIKIYGNNSGDIIILETSKIIARCCAETDVIARFSGKDIAILVSGCSIERVRDLSEQIRHEIESSTIITPDGNFPVTATIGASFMSFEQGETPPATSNIIISAGTALAQAKEKGNNRVEIIP